MTNLIAYIWKSIAQHITYCRMLTSFQNNHLFLQISWSREFIIVCRFVQVTKQDLNCRKDWGFTRFWEIPCVFRHCNNHRFWFPSPLFHWCHQDCFAGCQWPAKKYLSLKCSGIAAHFDTEALNSLNRFLFYSQVNYSVK